MFELSPSRPVYRIILMRHGESAGNAAGLHQGQKDFELTSTGKSQAASLARRWTKESRHFDLIISSPLKRAHETAVILANELNVPIEVEPLWMERDNGLLSGLRPEEGQQISPRPGFMHPYQPVGETGESQWALFIRAGQAIQAMLSKTPGHYLVVSHGGILNLAMYAILGIPLQANFTGPRFRFGNTAFATLSYRPDEHKWTVYGVNDQNHWKEKKS